MCRCVFFSFCEQNGRELALFEYICKCGGLEEAKYEYTIHGTLLYQLRKMTILHCEKRRKIDSLNELLGVCCF
jgi:hypothetical protein